MKFPTFPDSRMVGLTACGNLTSPSEEALVKLQELHDERAFITYRANKGMIHSHVLGGKNSSKKHIHIDLFKSELLRVDNLKPPADTSNKTKLSLSLDSLKGQSVKVTYTGTFLVNRSELSTSRLIQPILIGGNDEARRRIEMTSATFEMVGLQLRRLEWKIVSEEKMKIELTYVESRIIADDYLTLPQGILASQFDLFVLGRIPDAHDD